MLGNISNIKEIISNTTEQEVSFLINETEASNSELKELFKCTEEKLSSGVYIVARNNTLNSVKVKLTVTKNADIEFKVNVKAGEVVDLWAYEATGNANVKGQWIWEIIGKSGKIDWGDGNVTSIASKDKELFKHTYNKADSYSINIFNLNFSGSGVLAPISEGSDVLVEKPCIYGDALHANFMNFYMGNSSNYNYLTRSGLDAIEEIIFNTPQVVYSAVCTFIGLKNCKKISGTIKLSEDRYGITKPTTTPGLEPVNHIECSSTFMFCPALEDLSDLKFIWSNAENPVRFRYTFTKCTNLPYEGIKGFDILNLSDKQKVDYHHTFRGCESLTKIPRFFMNGVATRHHSCFENAGIKFLPPGILDNSVYEDRTFAFCPLKGVSKNLKLDKLKSVGGSMFEYTELDYEGVKNIYNALPTYSGGSSDVLLLGIKCTEEDKNKIRTLLNISDSNLPTSNASTSNDKGWPIKFTIKNLD